MGYFYHFKIYRDYLPKSVQGTGIRPLRSQDLRPLLWNWSPPLGDLVNTCGDEDGKQGEGRAVHSLYDKETSQLLTSLCPTLSISFVGFSTLILHSYLSGLHFQGQVGNLDGRRQGPST